MPVAISYQDQKSELEAILASAAFRKCPNLARLLEYIGKRYLEGRAQDLKEYNIGVEALGRPVEFDPTTNSIVRVEFHRLRERLKKYYETEGANDPIVLCLQPGSYVPLFRRREDQSSEAAPQASLVRGSEQPASDRKTDIVPKPGHIRPLARPTGTRPVSAFARGTAALLGLAALAGVVAAVIWKAKSGPSTTAVTAAASARSRPTMGEVEPPEAAVRILAGYTKKTYVDRAGHVWSGDRYYNGGRPVSQPRQFIYRTLDPTLFQTQRFGEFSYDIPLRPGTYELRLYFAELNYGPGTLSGGGETSRVFNVTMNGQPLLTGFDVFADVGGNNTADVRVFKDVTPASDGYLHLRFLRVVDEPMVNAIELVPGVPGKLHPIRIVAQENCFTDSQGRAWNPDNYFRGGRLTLHKGPVENTSDPDLYDGERFGHFDYAIPVAPGKYTVTLHFAETYFGQQNPGAGGVGSRIFSVYCNGAILLPNFDIFREAGGANRAIEKSFRGLKPDAQGKLLLSFVPVQNYACVNAIEVVSD